MSTGSKTLRVVERVFLFWGVLLLAVFSFAYMHRFAASGAEMTKFEASRVESHDMQKQIISDTTRAADLDQTGGTNFSLWSAQRIHSYRGNLASSAEALAVLRIPRLRLEVPVLEGTDELTLNSGVGTIAGTSRPGEAGNIGIAGHRDGFFRPLKDISTGDAIELVTKTRTDIYEVERVRITRPTDVSVLQPKAKPSLTLVTCYPFYLVGPAPKRYIVEASLKQ